MKLTSQRLVFPVIAVLVVAFFGVLALLPATPAGAQATATKSCVPSGTNLYTCTLTITPSVATGSGAWLVQMVTPGPGTLIPPPAVSSSPGCTVAPSISAPGSLINSSLGNADYDVMIGSGGCAASAVVTITETIAVSASGQVCQRVWVTTGSPFVTACDTVVFTPSPAPSAAKDCSLTSTPNLYSCTFTVMPGVATGAGPWLVQMVSPGPGTFASTPVVSPSTTGCSALPTVSAPGSLISSPFGTADYDIVIGAGGCNANAAVVITEMVTVTASGQICQRVWVTTASPYMTACDSVVFTPAGVAAAEKSCTLTSTPNVYTCSFVVTPAFPAVAGDIVHVNEAPGPLMTGPGSITSTPTVGLHGCPETPSPVVMTSSTSYNAQIGPSGCSGTTWTVEFIETITVTASGQICQSFYMVTAVPPVTACATVQFAKSLAGTPQPGKFSGSIATSGISLLIFGGGSVADLSAAATAEGAASVWLTVNGKLIGYIPGAPAFVNAHFNTAFTGGVPFGPLVLVMPPPGDFDGDGLAD